MPRCSSCHGNRLQGGNAQSLVDGVWQFGADRGYILRNIKYGGIPHLGMPSYGQMLSDQQVELPDIEQDRVIHAETILKNAGRVRDVASGPDGAIYVVLNPSRHHLATDAIRREAAVVEMVRGRHPATPTARKRWVSSTKPGRGRHAQTRLERALRTVAALDGTRTSELVRAPRAPDQSGRSTAPGPNLL